VTRADLEDKTTWRRPQAGSDAALHAARSILRDLLGPTPQRALAVQYWDGSREDPVRPAPTTLVIRCPGALRRMLLPPSELAFGEAYLRDDIDLLGDIGPAMGVAEAIAPRLGSVRRLASLTHRLLLLPTDDVPEAAPPRDAHTFHLIGRRHSRARDAAAVQHHYDVGNDFYRLWMDAYMQYSPGRFGTGLEDLDVAQAAKLEYLCHTLQLQPGERLLDIGCGWGGLVQYAAERFGADALGITLSREQWALAHERLALSGAGKHCRVELLDYRDLPRDAVYDKIVSVGMFEHVGLSHMGRYFDEAWRHTRPGGLFLASGIVVLPSSPLAPLGWAARWLWREGEFTQRYVFPDGELATAGDIIRCAERAGFETRSVASDREAYALTLRHWVRHLESRHDEAVRLVGERRYRIWRLYMGVAAHGFATGRIGDIQVLLRRPPAASGAPA